ncbi:DNA polymerase III subunit delta [Legionella norrlandica]|uniref:DNA polymerase III subunit delta n=1 Tax=Legionella norrlandica TaxID=1498499 RepID=A0A0A2T7U4_9GAMM|nr:DNA polymerase III subunit delta [Legionella norrlandica]KGP63478.1 DNA polymerase III subunit delta [Legionella norrlandica]
MQINQLALTQLLQKKAFPLNIIIGQDTYLIDETLNKLKATFKKSSECDEKTLSIQSPEDWRIVIEEANNYSLFYQNIILTIFFDKKTMDTTGKKILGEYLKSINSRSFIIIRAPNLSLKQLQWLANEEQALVVSAQPLHPEAMKKWIDSQLKLNALNFDPGIPELIYQYTKGNMLATAQVIEKITLSNVSGSLLTPYLVLEHLSDQCDFSLFELVDTCLLGHADKAIHILRQAANNKTEATLILWILTQEIRIVLQLLFLMQQKIDVKTACQKLKIWPQRLPLYQASIKRLNALFLQQLHHYCQSIDERIKSNSNITVWHALENISLSLCLGRLIGDVCTA